MDHSFWHDRWESGRIGFHQDAPNVLLVTHFPVLDLDEGSRVFVPLCGKTRDIGWILSRGHTIVGAELSELAVRQLFEELGVEPTISQMGILKRYSAMDIDIFVGDIFALTAQMLGPVDAVFDRAALVALPLDMRADYALHIIRITQTAPQFLITFEYDQTLVKGPPFSIIGAEVRRLYGSDYDPQPVVSVEAQGGMKGAAATENVWRLKPL